MQGGRGTFSFALCGGQAISSDAYMEVLGIDIGGTGTKAAVVDTKTGELVTKRERLATPQPATPEALVETIAQLVQGFGWKGKIGCGFPGVIRHQTIHTAVNLGEVFVGLKLGEDIEKATGCPAVLINDADAAGVAEMEFGEGKGIEGVVILLTIGTGIGSAVFTDHGLVPNTELGHLEFKGKNAEKQLSQAAKDEKELSWRDWAKKFDRYLLYLDSLFWPERIILGGGGAKKPEKFWEYLSTEQLPLVTAAYGNKAGIIGAAHTGATGRIH